MYMFKYIFKITYDSFKDIIEYLNGKLEKEDQIITNMSL